MWELEYGFEGTPKHASNPNLLCAFFGAMRALCKLGHCGNPMGHMGHINVNCIPKSIKYSTYHVRKN